MCGLIAVKLTQPWLTPQTMQTALSTIGHRGPDGSAHWFSTDRLTALGHVRLSIIGLENGEQPLHHDRGDISAVVNGEFYGYRSIRDTLHQQGHHFNTESDSEIAVHLYEQHGLSFVDYLRGEFALVISDRARDEMIAVRDRFGIKPLFYAQRNGDIFFASEIKALLAIGVPARWDPEAVMSELALVRGNATMFADIHQVPPGCMLVAKDGKVEIKRYWDNTYPTASALADEARSETEIVSGFRDVLDDAVTQRLTADVEVACYLSGGLDSSAVLGLAQAKLDKPIRAFTIAFEGEFDESPMAERTAAFTGSNFEPIAVSPQALSDALSDTIWHSEKPIFNANTIAKFLLSKAVNNAGIKVVFTGEGADEMLAGYAFERRDNMLYGNEFKSEQDRQAAIAALIERNPLSKSLMFPVGESATGCELIRDALGFCPTWIENVSKQFVQLSRLMNIEALNELNPMTPYKTLLSEIDVAHRLRGRDAVNISLYTWQKSMLINFILTVLGDRMEMAHSIEGRVPFLDHHVAEYAANLPVSYKIRETTEKYVLREATKDVITQELYQRQKHPFVAPPMRKSKKNNVSDPLLQHCDDIIRSATFADQPFFDPKKACEFLDSLNKMEDEIIDQSSPLILRMATLSLMQQRFKISV